jgi:hypothetical protein
MAIRLSLHGELNVGMAVAQVVEDVLQFFRAVRSDHICEIHVTEPTSGLEGHPAKYHLLKVFCTETGNHR